MSDPIRLLHDERVGSAVAELLRALEPAQAPPLELHSALALQLSSLAARSAAPPAFAVSGLWLEATLVAVAMLGAAAALWQRDWGPEGEPVPDAVPVPTRPISVPPVSMPSFEPHAPEPPVPEVVPPPQRQARAASASSSVEPRDKLAEEEALLEEARSLLGASPARALGLLRSHQARFAGGQLVAERMYLKVDCLRRLGRKVEAQREAAGLTARYPSSAYARRAPLLLSSPAR